jgi:hypothetical protein
VQLDLIEGRLCTTRAMSSYSDDDICEEGLVSGWVEIVGEILRGSPGGVNNVRPGYRDVATGTDLCGWY